MGNRAQNLIYREEKKIIFLKIEKGKEDTKRKTDTTKKNLKHGLFL